MQSRIRARTTPLVQLDPPADPPPCPYRLQSVIMTNDMSCFKYNDVLQGEITFEMLTSTNFSGLWLQLEGTSIARITNSPEFVCQADKNFRFVTFAAPIVGLCNPSKAPTLTVQTHHISPGEHTYPVEFRVAEKILPASFDQEYAAIEYRMVVYCEFYEAKACWRYSSNLDPFKFKGYLNVSVPKLLKPIKMSRGGSIFTKSKPSVRLVVFKRAYIPGEVIRGTICVQNFGGEMTGDVRVRIVHKMIHADEFTRKQKTWELASDMFSVNSNEKEVDWEWSLELPRTVEPTYRKARHILDMFYILQFTVGLPEELKGECEIVIGTNSEDFQDEITEEVPEDADDLSYKSLPPSYSCLSSRRPSTSSDLPAYSTVCERMDRRGSTT